MGRKKLAHAFVAATRYGLGARPGELATIASTGPREWLAQQLIAPAAATRQRLAALPSSAARMQELAAMDGAESEAKKVRRMAARDAFADEQATHLVVAATSTTPFRERLVAFWANHFTVSAQRGAIVGIVGAFEREVVRGNLDRSFADMLVDSTRHPAMQLYLDNHRSVGPGSRAGTRQGKGLNENLAREVLELHTLGVDGGYTQADVEGLAKILTGWGIAKGKRGAVPGTFHFEPRRHEPGAKTLLSRTYPEGMDGGTRALRDLAAHPATATHLATKLARHFVADDPPRSAIAALEAAFRDSGGHLPAVHRALVALDEPFGAPLAKVKTPYDLVVSTARALGHTDAGPAMLAGLKYLGQLPYQAPSPQGWPDAAEPWLGPEAILGRLDWVAEAARTTRPVDVPALAADVLAPVLTDGTARAIAQASGADALALFLASPEFQRR